MMRTWIRLRTDSNSFGWFEPAPFTERESCTPLKRTRGGKAVNGREGTLVALGFSGRTNVAEKAGFYELSIVPENIRNSVSQDVFVAESLNENLGRSGKKHSRE
ncbi:hypothetical protein Nepgr_023328 [Nepenthes gracilis]|uniref:Uncharacterized protein n=1 Tax=Nepenthes gracilis TaxID=150966 RepID=A0AAD3T442_NEPGR|nr:hypothetical protein Nepgr_023328 [Nepenthes gracilis]